LKNKHLTNEDRVEIQDCLYKGLSFKAIAKRINKDQTTVSKEVKKNLTVRTDSRSDTQCQKLLSAPFVCNPCMKRANCGLAKKYYYAKDADAKYKKLLSDARVGIPLNKKDFYKMDATVSEGLKKGQHLYHILKSNNLTHSKSAIYNYRYKGYLSACATDFPRVAKFKPRKAKYMQYIPKKAKVGRTFEDFKAFCTENEITNWVEMDTLIGRIGGKVILTLHFTSSKFMIGMLLENKSAAEVTQKLGLLKAKINFSDLFKVILTDNGSEFSDINGIETAPDGKVHLFFCDPYQSSQKPHVEKNHTHFRDVVESGLSFDWLTQQHLNLIFSHINSIKRASLTGKTPYEMFTFLHGTDLAAVLGIKEVPAQEVIQSSKLLRQLKK